MAHESELSGLDFVAHTLDPIQLVVWGELAIRHLGVPVVHNVNQILFLPLSIMA
jgi:hypothetical protein